MDSAERTTDVPLESRRLLSLDIGITTGWATFKGTELQKHGIVKDVDLDKFCKEFSKKHWDNIIGEEPIVFRGSLGDALARTMFIIKLRLPMIETFYSVAWKGTKYGQAKTPKRISAHERDAIRFGVWYMNVHL